MKSNDYLKKFSGSASAEIKKEISRLQSTLYGLYSDAVKGKIKNVRESKKTRKEIAQLKTLLKEKK